MLGINGLDAADFLKEVLITLEDKIYFLLQDNLTYTFYKYIFYYLKPLL